MHDIANFTFFLASAFPSFQAIEQILMIRFPNGWPAPVIFSSCVMPPKKDSSSSKMSNARPSITKPIDVTSKPSRSLRPRCHSLSTLGNTTDSDTSSSTPVKPTRVQLGKCPCLKSDNTSWKIKCVSCNQTWHTMCANIKAHGIPETVIRNLQKTWMCPWCYSTPVSRPPGHPSSKNESQLMGSVISDTIGDRILEEISNSIVPQLQQAVDTTVQDRLKDMAILIEEQGKRFEESLKELEAIKSSLMSSSTNGHSRSQSTVEHPQSTICPPTGIQINPTNHIEDYDEAFLNTEQALNLHNSLDNNVNYTNVNGRKVASFGEDYKYAGSPNSNISDIPDWLKLIIDKVHGSDEYKDAQINQVVINRYTGKTHLPEHSDDEDTIRPESTILTLTLGHQMEIIFKDKVSGREEKISPENGCLYAMSKSSQHFWTHRIVESDIEDSVRTSITFRSVGQNYKNSTLILGDSNTKHLKFSTSVQNKQGTFGYKLPGKRVETFHIKNIDPNKCIGYQNILIHCGINDIRDNSPGRESTDPEPSDTNAYFQNLIQKITEIKLTCPYASVFISPILPTRNLNLNSRVVQFNHLLFDFISNDVRGEGVRSLNLSEFLDERTGILRDDLRVWDSSAQCYSKRDILHIGKTGIRLLAGCIRDGILKKSTTSRSYSSTLTHKITQQQSHLRW